MKNVEQFAEDKGLNEHVELIKKGALIAQDRAKFENLDALNEEERELPFDLKRTISGNTRGDCTLPLLCAPLGLRSRGGIKLGMCAIMLE